MVTRRLVVGVAVILTALSFGICAWLLLGIAAALFDPS